MIPFFKSGNRTAPLVPITIRKAIAVIDQPNRKQRKV